MMKVIIGLLAVAVVAVGGYFGFEFYVQQRIANDVEATFAAVRASGAKAAHGKVTFDLWTRTVTVADISDEFTAEPPASVKIGRVTAVGVNQQDGGRFTASRIEATDVAVSGTIGIHGGLQTSYQAPRIEVVDYAGPAGPLRRLDSTTAADIYRFALEHFAAVTAKSVTAPALAVKFAPASSAPGIAGDYTYSAIALNDIKDGKVATSTVNGVSFTATVNAAGKAETIAGEVGKLVSYDFDSGAILAMLDPARAKDDKYYRAYRQVTVGPYTASLPQGLKMRIDGVTIDDVGLRPSRLQFSQLMAIIEAAPAPGTTPTPEKMRDLLGKVAGLYEGIRIGGAELRGLSMDTPQGPLKLGAFKLINLENGKIGEFALQDLEAKAPQGPVKLGRFALKGLDVTNLMRLSAQFAASPQKPSPEQIAALMLLLEGAEISKLVAPYKDTGKPVSIDTLNISWGQFIGPVPSRARVTLKMSGPVDASDPDPFKMLAAAGISDASLNFDIGAAWAENGRALELEPATVELGGVGSVQARLSVGNVAREVFSVNPLQVAIMAAQIEAGPLMIRLHDLGGVDLAITQQANEQAISPDAARQAILDNIREATTKMAAINPDVTTIGEALTRFIQNPRGTLTIKLTPKSSVALMQIVQAMKTSPIAALARFQVEATAGR